MSDNLNFQSNYDVSLFCLIDIQVSSGFLSFFSIKLSLDLSLVCAPKHLPSNKTRKVSGETDFNQQLRLHSFLKS